MALVELIDKHRAAFDYDWRTRFRLPVSAVGGKRMPWGEAIRLLGILSSDPSSQVATAIAEWDHPASREALVLMDLYDLQHRAKAKRKPPPYPRPWNTARRAFGRGTALTKTALRAILDQHRGATSTKRDKKGRLRDARGRYLSEPKG